MSYFNEMRILLCSSVITLLVLGAELHAEDQPLSPKSILKTAGVEIDAKRHEVRLEAMVCLERGILEYLVCLPGTFEHEAAFSTKCTPSLLHMSLLAVGLETCECDPDGDWGKASLKKPHSRMRVEVEFEKDGKKVRLDVCDLIKSRQNKSAKKFDLWVFSGSRLGERDGKRVYAADILGSVVGLGMDSGSVIQIGTFVGNPYQNEEEGLEIDGEKIPAKGTKAQLIFSHFSAIESPIGTVPPQKESKL